MTPKINCREFTIKLEGKKEKVDLKKNKYYQISLGKKIKLRSFKKLLFFNKISSVI